MQVPRAVESQLLPAGPAWPCWPLRALHRLASMQKRGTRLPPPPSTWASDSPLHSQGSTCGACRWRLRRARCGTNFGTGLRAPPGGAAFSTSSSSCRPGRTPSWPLAAAPFSVCASCGRSPSFAHCTSSRRELGRGVQRCLGTFMLMNGFGDEWGRKIEELWDVGGRLEARVWAIFVIFRSCSLFLLFATFGTVCSVVARHIEADGASIRVQNQRR